MFLEIEKINKYYGEGENRNHVLKDVNGSGRWTQTENRPAASPSLSRGSAPTDRKSTRLNSSHIEESRMPSSA